MGEVYFEENENVFNVSKSENWHKCKYMPFDLINQSKMPMWTRKNIILETISLINSPFITAPMQFNSFNEGWEYVKANKKEGLVLRTKYGDMYKCKLLQEMKIKISSHESGSDKGTFILENGNRISGTSMSFVNKFETLKDKTDLIAEVEYGFMTETGKMFQPRLRRIMTAEEFASESA
jgi:hypothetical protein